jgi:hypothetical protein
MLGLYLIVAVVLLLVAYAGVDETMRLFAYLDLQLRFAWIRFRMMLMRRKLKRQLEKSFSEYHNLKETSNNDR